MLPHYLLLCLLMLVPHANEKSPLPLPAQPELQASTTHSQTSFPEPKGIPNMLFYLQRDPDPNTVVYQLNLTDEGRLNEAEPIKVFWIRYAEQGQRRELNYIHRKFAFGVNTKKISPEKYEFHLVSHDKIRFLLSKGKDGNFHVYTTIANQNAILKRIYVRIESGGSFWVPNIPFVDFFGIQEGGGKEIVGRYIPKKTEYPQ
ncbi:hypothetical protein BH24BAC1_BH24BAC1_07400 [soil metagenome]